MTRESDRETNLYSKYKRSFRFLLLLSSRVFVASRFTDREKGGGGLNGFFFRVLVLSFKMVMILQKLLLKKHFRVTTFQREKEDLGGFFVSISGF